MSPGRRGFAVALFGVRVGVACESAVMGQVLDRYVCPWLPRAEIEESPLDRLVEVRAAGAGDGLEILIDGEPHAHAPSPLAAIPRVQRAIDEAIVRRQSEVAIVHAGAVAFRGGAIVLPGPTGSGKSTLVAELVRRGAAYLSDEYAVIDREGRVHAYPRPLLLRDGRGEDRPPVLAAELGGTVAHGPIRAGVIAAVRHVAGAAPAFETATQAEGVLLLLRNTPQALADQPWILTPLTRAIQAAACYVGVRGEAGAAAEAILALASSDEAQVAPPPLASPVRGDMGSAGSERLPLSGPVAPR